MAAFGVDAVDEGRDREVHGIFDSILAGEDARKDELHGGRGGEGGGVEARQAGVHDEGLADHELAAREPQDLDVIRRRRRPVGAGSDAGSGAGGERGVEAASPNEEA